MKDFRTGRLAKGLPLVSIGVLSYNYSKYIQAALNSILDQTYPNIELIIVDDCSIETETRQIIRQWISDNNIHCIYIENKKNLGITAVSNIIVQQASGKYLNFFATDDIMLPEKIEQQVRILENVGEEFGMCYSNVQTMDEAGNLLGLYSSSTFFPEGDVIEAYTFGHFSFATPSALIRKSCYKIIGVYDERVLIEDYNFWIRLFALFKVAYCKYPAIIYRVKKSSEIWEKWFANGKERYYFDRILSNYQALQYVTHQCVRRHLHKKICQYLKSLAFHNSIYFTKAFCFLFLRGYWKMPYKYFVASAFKRMINK